MNHDSQKKRVVERRLVEVRAVEIRVWSEFYIEVSEVESEEDLLQGIAGLLEASIPERSDEDVSE